ncbi:MAG: hypothetical protein Q6K70_03475 [Thermostichales cyanobacterium DRC_bins_46]
MKASVFTAPTLDKLARDLEKDANGLRIKKLILYVCRRQWENNPAALDQLSMVDLLQEMQMAFPTHEDLIKAFRHAIQTISKKTEYSLIANIILNKIQGLYQQNPETGGEASTELGPEYDIFELRLNLMRQANPLRAKILLFSALYHPIGYTDQGLGIVKTHSLDDLLKSLFLRCKTQAEMEHKIRTAASFLGDPDQTEPVAEAIVQSLRPWFSQRMQQLSQAAAPAVVTSPAPPPVDRGASLGLPLDVLPAAEEALGWLEQLPPPVVEAPAPAAAPTPAAPQVREQAAEEAAVIALLGNHPELHKQIKLHIKRSLTEMMSSIENILTELGNALDEELQEQDPKQALLVKYRSLREFIHEAEGTPSKFLEMLNKLETAERKLFGL